MMAAAVVAGLASKETGVSSITYTAYTHTDDECCHAILQHGCSCGAGLASKEAGLSSITGAAYACTKGQCRYQIVYDGSSCGTGLASDPCSSRCAARASADGECCDAVMKAILTRHMF